MKIGQKEIKIDKTRIVICFLVFWFVLSAGYLGWNYVLGTRQAVLRQGYGLAVQDLLAQAENEECRPFSIFLEDRQIDLINVVCLSGSEELGEPIGD